MSRLMEYFIEVDRSAVMRAAHQSEPVASMSKFGLTADEQDALMSGEFGRVASAIGICAEKSQLSAIMVPQTIAVDSQLPSIMVPQTIGTDSQLPAIMIPQTIAMFHQLPAMQIPQSIGTFEH